MIITEYNELGQISGLTAFISVLIGFLLGSVVLYKSIKTKQKVIFLFFLCVIFTLSPWYPSGGGYLYWLISDELFSYELYVLLGNVGIPIAIIAWVYVYKFNIYPEKGNKLIIAYVLFSIIFEIYLFYFTLLAPDAPVRELLGVIEDSSNPTDINYKGLVLIYLAASIVTACVTGIHFSVKSMKIKKNPELKWKGRFLLIAFIFFGFSATMDAIVEMNIFLLLIVRTFLILTTFFFYLGFILPKWIQRLLSIDK
ncbi:MAG: hypothetical protein ACOC44_10680 [Promethearchaeia archaeon]